MHDSGWRIIRLGQGEWGPPPPQKGKPGLEKDQSCSEGSFHGSRLANSKVCHGACGWGRTDTVLVGGAADMVP